MPKPPNILFVMTDQQRFDTIAALGNGDVYTPNLDRLVRRGVAFTNAYSTCPVCVPARYTVRTGFEPPTTRIFSNARSAAAQGQAETLQERCGPYLAQTMRERGYRTFGIGKFHTQPWDEELGYDVHLHSEELYGAPDQRRRDAYARWIAEEHPAFDYIEALMGERTEMYYMPQVSPLPAALTVECWAADRAVEQLTVGDGRPTYGFVSFIGPHPPFAPPVPFNRMYDPDRMPNPVCGDPDVDLMDEQLRWMNYAIFADDISDARARALRARYYGEISYIDDCLGRILDAVETRPDADNTLICFFADHGDHLGDHHAWLKESFFEAACHVPFLLSWPAQLPGDVRRDELVTLTDLFAIATGAAGEAETRDGIDVLGMLSGEVAPRPCVVGMYGEPGTPLFKVMVREARNAEGREWKYVFLANGGHRQLFDLASDPHEVRNLTNEHPGEVRRLHATAAYVCDVPGARDALGGGSGGCDLRAFPYKARPLVRIYQFDHSRGVAGFPACPEDVLGRS